VITDTDYGEDVFICLVRDRKQLNVLQSYRAHGVKRRTKRKPTKKSQIPTPLLTAWRACAACWSCWKKPHHMVKSICLEANSIWCAAPRDGRFTPFLFGLLLFFVHVFPCDSAFSTLWARPTKNTDRSTEPLAYPFARSLICLLRTTCFSRALTHSLPRSWDSDGDLFSVFFFSGPQCSDDPHRYFAQRISWKRVFLF